MIKYVLVYAAVIAAAEVALLAMAILSLDETRFTPTTPMTDSSLFCGVVVENHVGIWFCPITLAQQ